jgi:sec-independent protein translocase protein TatA
MLIQLAFLQQIGPVGLIVILIIALLLFGKRLPDVARSLGKGIVEFKKGVRGIEDDVEGSIRESERSSLHGGGSKSEASSVPPASPPLSKD